MISNVKKFCSKIEFLQKAKFKTLYSHSKKIMEIEILNICTTKFSVSLWAVNETEKLQKTTDFNFCAINF